MSKHLTLEMLAALQDGRTSPLQEQQMRVHLSNCMACAQLADALALVNHDPSPQTIAATNSANSCLAPEDFANYLNQQLGWWQRRRMQRHLSACQSCRSTLADMIRIDSTSLTQADLNWLKSLPNFILTPVPAAVFLNEAKHTPARPRWRGKNIFETRPAPAYALAFAVVVVLIAMFGWPEFSVWQSQRLAQQGLETLTQSYDIASASLRPSGNFQPRLLSGTRKEATLSSSHIAQEKFQGSLGWNAENRLALRGRALLAFFEGDFAAADSLLRILLSHDPNNPETLNDLAVVLAARAPELALPYVERALAQQPELRPACFNRAYLLQKLKRNEEARQAWQAYLKLHDDAEWESFAHLLLRQLEASLLKKN